jgi:hypothetical protein
MRLIKRRTPQEHLDMPISPCGFPETMPHSACVVGGSDVEIEARPSRTICRNELDWLACNILLAKRILNDQNQAEKTDDGQPTGAGSISQPLSREGDQRAKGN